MSVARPFRACRRWRYTVPSPPACRAGPFGLCLDIVDPAVAVSGAAFERAVCRRRTGGRVRGWAVDAVGRMTSPYPPPATSAHTTHSAFTPPYPAPKPPALRHAASPATPPALPSTPDWATAAAGSAGRRCWRTDAASFCGCNSMRRPAVMEDDQLMRSHTCIAHCALTFWKDAGAGREAKMRRG